jgi:hypothetical protein
MMSNVQEVSAAMTASPTVSPAPSADFKAALISAAEELKGGETSSSPSVSPAPSMGRRLRLTQVEHIPAERRLKKKGVTVSPTVSPAPSTVSLVSVADDDDDDDE